MSNGVISINSNISSLRVQRKLTENSNQLSSTFERLSSGLRINTASDDAAGLAVSSSLNLDTRVYAQGVRNLNDGISVLTIADATIESLDNIVIRLQELAEQSANGSLGTSQRKSLDAEAQALSEEYFRIARSTSFNGLNIFRGEFGSLTLQAGYGSNGLLSSGLGGAVGSGNFAAVSTQYATESVRSRDLAIADLNGDGIVDMVTAGIGGGATVRLGLGNGVFSSSATQYSTESGWSEAVSLADLNGDGILDLVTAGIGGGQGWATVRTGKGDGTFFSTSTQYLTESNSSYALSLGDLNGDGCLDLVTAGWNGSAGEVTVRMGVGNGSFSSASTHYSTSEWCLYTLSLADINGDGALDLVSGGYDGGSGWATVRMGLGNGTFSSSSTRYSTEATCTEALSLADLNGDDLLDMISTGDNGGVGGVTVRLGVGNGVFSSSSVHYSAESNGSYDLSLSDLNGDGCLDLLTSGDDTGSAKATIRMGSGDGSFSSTATQYSAESGTSRAIALSDINQDGVPDLVTAGEGGGGKVTTRLSLTQNGVAPILSFDLSTMAGARQAINLFKQKQEQLSLQRGIIGAFQARVQSAIGTVNVSMENFAMAASRVTDADIAAESSALLRTQILQETGAAILAQANQQPALALRLLRE